MHPNDIQGFADLGVHINSRYARDAFVVTDAMKAGKGMAMDALPPLVTAPNQGIPAFLGTAIDPAVIRVVTQPTKSTVAFGETQKGNMTTPYVMFPVIEMTGEVSSYGDYSNNGRAGHNVNFITRQSYNYQTFTEWGELEVEYEALANINYVGIQNEASAFVLNRFSNIANLYGIANMQLYGALNDPSLPATIAPGPKAAGPITWPLATPNEIYTDFLSLFGRLQTQLGGNAEMTDEMTLVLSPGRQVFLAQINQFGLSALSMIKQSFEKLTIVNVPEYATAAGELMQLRLNKIDGQETTYCAFTEKLRTHAIVQGNSSFSQKKSAGTMGFICRYPIALAGMLGI